ncbi:ABC transporter permease [Halalkalibacter alkaliphilus]|uniref:ABC transporter permease n=1 Tax=Halalkalibacter alkaliphilus TaxID=2917993 RepID=A0A9X2CR94_9BACI|nr:ABC transporter permease [Halalkalibacter alkaliphilus]MCL7745529.1 ABC transporter permease [Halalkalibacter alkaliphilus]
MGNFLKKDLLVLLRDRTELMILLLMPILLIVILSFALRGILGGDTSYFHMDVAFVIEDDEQQGVIDFIEDLETIGMPREVIMELEQVVEEVKPYTMLEDLMNNESVSNMVTMEELEFSEAEEALENEDVTAILLIPEDFTYRSLQKMLLNEGGGSELKITVKDYSSIRTDVFVNIVNRYVNTVNFETAISQTLIDLGHGDVLSNRADGEVIETREFGGVESISAREPITSFQYYTVSMAVMFVLFVGAAIASKAYVEKKQHVFNRIILSNRHPIVYLGGKMISASVISFLQLIILFLVSTLAFRTFPLDEPAFWGGIAIIAIILAICVGGFASLLTALTVKYENDALNHIFSGGIVTLLALVGGSFFPTSEMPALIGTIGNWTPNGAALTAFLKWMQELNMTTILPYLIRIATLAAILIISSILIFPKRRSL